MKSLMISILLFAFAQTAQAAPVLLNEGQSKKLYNALAVFGLRTPHPADYQTREWAKPVICARDVAMGGVTYTCLLHDEFHNVNVQKSGMAAKNIYLALKAVNGADCEGSRCISRSTDVKCIYYWPNKQRPPERRYLCAIEPISAAVE